MSQAAAMLTAEPRLISEQMGFSSGARPLPPGARHPWRRERFDFSCGQLLPFFPALESMRVHEPASSVSSSSAASEWQTRPGAASPLSRRLPRAQTPGRGRRRLAGSSARAPARTSPNVPGDGSSVAHAGRHRRPRAQTARPAVSLPSVGRGGTSCHSRRVSIKYKENTSARSVRFGVVSDFITQTE